MLPPLRGGGDCCYSLPVIGRTRQTMFSKTAKKRGYVKLKESLRNYMQKGRMTQRNEKKHTPN